MRVDRLYHEDPDYYADRATGLLASAADGTPTAVAAFARHGAPVTPEGARTVVAGEHGFPAWPALLEAVAGLRASGAPFAAAYRALEAHDPDALATALDAAPDLVTATGTNGNDLLGMASATGSLRAVKLLLDRGADPTRGNAHGWTPLHQTAYSEQATLTRLLLDRGADPTLEARGTGGTPLVVALFWGNRTVAELLLAAGGPFPDNLRVAAGTGDVARIDALLGSAGPPGRAPGTAGPPAAPPGGAARGFYRPHSGFPAWTPSDAPQEVLDEALAWAARNDRPDALDPLVAAGARPDADVYRGTALVWAAATGRAAAAQRLLDLGADPDARSTFGGPDHGAGVTALHLAAQNGNAEVARILVAAGADRTLRDDLHGGHPADWATFGGHQRLSAELEP